MLKPIHYIALVACISLHCVRANAQTSLGEKVITADAGLSLVGGAMDVIIGSGEEIDLDTNNNFFEINNLHYFWWSCLGVEFRLWSF